MEATAQAAEARPETHPTWTLFMVMMFVALVYILVRGTVPPDSVSTAKSGWSIVSIEGLAVTITSFIARHRDNHWRSWWIVTASIGTAAAIAGAVLSLVW